MQQTTAHIINHTHWDREWFLTSQYTTQWIPGLIDRLEELVEKNDAFHYLLDGQTLIIEDLLGQWPEYAEKIERLVSAGNLQIGPYYCQPDWQCTRGETLVRNLQYGAEIMHRFGGETHVGWMVDTFGHVSQSPQLHRKFGLDSVYVWRGVPELMPYFEWEGAHGETLFAIDLFGGYRNLYGVTHAPSVAVERLKRETERLVPYYPTPNIPLFDGYDLEDNPEDPVRWFAEHGSIPEGLILTEETPTTFAEKMREIIQDTPHVVGELNSGKFGATFPGTFSSRPYLKLLAHDVEHLLYQVYEPLSLLAAAKGAAWGAEQPTAWSKIILQNAVHDAICGVSIDQVHEKMEYLYRQIQSEMQTAIQTKLDDVFRGFASGRYVVNTSLLAFEKWIPTADGLVHVVVDGLGVRPMADPLPIDDPAEPVTDFSWSNDHYEAEVTPAGLIRVGKAELGEIRVSAERGDTYSDETGAVLGKVSLTGPMKIVAKAEGYAVLEGIGALELDDGQIDCVIRYTFDPSPLIGVEIEIDSTGVNFHAELMLTSGAAGQIWAGMPFDRVKRDAVDTNYLPRELEPKLHEILMGQRELNTNRTFPMQRFVGFADAQEAAILFAKGNRAYRSWESGEIGLSLRRSVEWVTESDLENRIGDAGPFFYVPDGRCERKTTHQLALYVGEVGPQDPTFSALEEGFMHEPMLVDVVGNGDNTELLLGRSDQPVSAVWLDEDQIFGRVWHASGDQLGLIEEIELGRLPEFAGDRPTEVTCLNPAAERVGWNQGLPDEVILQSLREKAVRLGEAVQETEAQLATATGDARLKLEHQVYKYDRERHETLLSVRLNELKLAQQGALNADYLFELDPEVVTIGNRLNQLRIKRRIFDYVVTVL